MSRPASPGFTLKGFSSPGLAPLDLHISPAQCVSLAGPSGCGKTRLLRALADLDPHQGEAYLDGQPLSDTPPPLWRQQVGLLTAESHWWQDTVAEHFAKPEPRLLQVLGLPEACMDWSISRLSSGERQRLALARLLSNHPRVLLLDEPTANLDRENTLRVEQLLQEYQQQHGACILWISHDPEQRQRVAELHLIVNDGRLESETWS